MHGVRVVSFEPNSECHTYFRQICKLNSVECQIEALALGSCAGTVDLWFPPGQEWLGTTLPSVRDDSKVPMGSWLQVQQTTVDDYVETHQLVPDIVKIDVEGAEAEVLEGSLRTLASSRPFVMFESWPHSDRERFAKLFASQRYSIVALPLLAHCPAVKLSREEFLSDAMANFGAAPDEMVETWTHS
jgi:FkbM family methyltransferase